jgi:hypothetical protein
MDSIRSTGSGAAASIVAFRSARRPGASFARDPSARRGSGAMRFGPSRANAASIAPTIHAGIVSDRGVFCGCVRD